MEILERERLDPAVAQMLAPEIEPLRTLGDLLDWCRALSPPVSSPEVITQDEYTHDVLVPWRRGLVLAFDTT